MIAERPVGYSMDQEPAPPILLADVRADMNAIFGSVPGPAGPVSGRTAIVRPPGTNQSFSRTPIRSRTMALFACTAAGLLVGVTAAGGLHLTGVKSGSMLRPMAPPMAGVAPNPFEAEPAATTVQVRQALSTARAPSRSNAPVKNEERTMVVRASVLRTPGTGHAREDQPVQIVSRCEGDRLERARCMRPDILDADRRLRRAYAEAIRQGVERHFLVEHRRRWARLRTQAIRDPDDVLEGYGELAGALERLSVHGRAADRIS